MKKKNVKYIGSAVAVALLAAGSPVVIHSLIPTIEVKADDTQVDPVKDAAIKYFTKFKNQYGTTRYASSFKNLAKPLYEIDDYAFDVFPYFNSGGSYGGGALIYDFNHDYNFTTGLSLLKEYVDPDVTFANSNNTVHLYQKVTAYISVSDPESKDNPATSTHPAGAEELSTGPALKAFADKLAAGKVGSPLTITIHLGSANNDADANKTLSYLPDDLKTFSFTFDKSSLNLTSDTDQDLTLATGATGNDNRLQPADGASTNSTLKVTDNYALSDIDAMSAIQKPHYGKSLYSSQEAALKAADTDTFNPNATDLGSATTNPGTYYQTISYQLLSDTDTGDDALNHAVLGTPDGKAAGAILEPYETYIDGRLGTNGTDYVLNNKTGYLTIVRAVDVGGTIAPNFDSSVSVGLNNKKSTIDPKDYTIKNGNRNISSSVTTDGEYYTDPGASTKVSADQVSDDAFLKPGPYYRKITFTLDNGNISDYYKIYGNDNGEYTVDGNKITYIQKVIVKNVATSTVKEAKANVGDSISVSTATEGNDITDSDRTSLLVKSDSNPYGVSFGTDYYAVSPTDANKQAILNDPTEVGQPTADVVKDGVFNKAGTYLRTITFYLTKNEIANNTFNGVDPNVKVSEENSTVTYVQTITINPNEVTPTINDVHTMIGTSVTDSGLHDPSTVELPSGDESLLDKTKGDNDSGISFGNTYYDDSTLQNETKDISKTSKLNVAKTYHRLVTFYLTDTAYNQSHFNGSFTHSDQDKSISYMQDVIVDPSTKTATFGNHDLDVPYNTATNSSTLTETSDYTLVDDDGNTGSIEDSVSLDGKYYATEADAKAGTNALTIDNLTNPTYYRVITIKVKSGYGYLYSYPGASFVDAENDEVQYIQKISVDKDIATITVNRGSVISGSILSKIVSGGDSTIEDSDGSTTGVFGTTYYDNPDDAINNSSNTSSRIILDRRNNRVTGPSGTIYRTVTFTLNPGPASNYTFEVQNNQNIKYIINGNKVICAQPIDISIAKVTTVTINPKTISIGSSPSDISTNIDFGNGPVDIVVKYQSGFLPISLVDETKALQFGTTYYDKDTLVKDTDVLANGKFNKAGSFYREVTIPLKNNYAASYDFDINDQYVTFDTAHDTVTYLQEIDVSANPAQVNAGDITLTAGDSTDSVAKDDGYTLSLADDATKTIPAEVMSLGTTYYMKAEYALAGGTTGVATGAVTDGKFNKGDYFRVITFKPTDGKTANYTFAGDNVKVNADGTVSYAQEIKVGTSSDVNVSDAVKKATVKVNVTSDDGDNSALSSTEGYTLTDKDGKSLVVSSGTNSGISFSPEFYDNNGMSQLSDGAKGFSVFRAGNFFRYVNFTVSDATLANYDFKSIGGKVNGNTVSFVQEVDASTNQATDTIASHTVSNGSSSTSKTLNNPDDIKLTDSDKNSIIGGTPIFGSFYDSMVLAKEGKTPTSNINSNGSFTKAKTYYQTVTVPLIKNGANAYSFHGDNVVGVDKTNNTVTFIRTITVNPSSSGNSGSNSGSNTGDNGSGDEDEWTYYKDPGVVTTKTTQPSYSLNNRANETVENRALAQDTSWITDQYRTNKAGVKQYRVATGEWIDSNDVYFRENSTGNNGDDDWTYYNNPGVVTTKTTQPSYSLNNRANETVENRALAQDTSWITDQYRTNKAGVKQYRVATGEWIDSQDVIFNGQTTDEEDGWTYYKDPGIVVTKPDQEYYSLNNRANDTIKNRALMEKTSWITDQYRTNRQGVKQYRVATNEWIDSHDVIFTKNVKQIVNVDETAPYYSLYTIYGQLVQNRALEQKTSWFSDKVAYADDGTVYYRVATNEWVKQIDGVHLASYAWYKY